jgi:hypothetical protein
MNIAIEQKPFAWTMFTIFREEQFPLRSSGSPAYHLQNLMNLFRTLKCVKELRNRNGCRFPQSLIEIAGSDAHYNTSFLLIILMIKSFQDP